METSLQLKEIINVVEAISRQDSKAAKRNIICANRGNRHVMEAIRYLLGDPEPGFTEKELIIPVFNLADPPKFTELSGLLSYYRCHKDVEDRVLATQWFIRSRPREEREQWTALITKKYKLGSEQYLRTQLLKGEYK